MLTVNEPGVVTAVGETVTETVGVPEVVKGTTSPRVVSKAFEAIAQ